MANGLRQTDGEDLELGFRRAAREGCRRPFVRAVVPSLPLAPWKPLVADRDIDPAVNTHADAVCRVVAATLVDQAGRQPRYQHFVVVGRAVAVSVLKDAQKRRVQTPRPAVLRDHAARVIHFGKHVHLVGLAVAVLIETAHDPAAAGSAPERPLLIHGHIDRSIKARPTGRPGTPAWAARQTG